MTTALQRITTEYIELEDRVRLAGETGNGERLVLWLTRRLLDRLVPHLVAWLEKSAGPQAPASRLYAEARQGFARDAARAGLRPEPPVPASAASRSWLVGSVDVSLGEASIRLNFKGLAESDQACLDMREAPLRQWLGIIHGLYLRAAWPTGPWPDWMGAAGAPAAQHGQLMH